MMNLNIVFLYANSNLHKTIANRPYVTTSPLAGILLILLLLTNEKQTNIVQRNNTKDR